MKMKTMAAVALVGLFGLTAGATTRYWTGAGANAKASTAANWLSDKNDSSTTGAPVAGDDVVFDSAGEGKACTWDLDISLAAWKQEGYTSTVTIMTVFDSAGFDCLTITGDVDLKSGEWTHEKNPTDSKNTTNQTYRLHVTCGGNFTVGANAKVNASVKGFTYGGWGRVVPGLQSGGLGPAHGGRGTDQYNSKTVCYGSIVEPTQIGSGGCPAGGAIRMIVSGTMTINGVIEADGRKTYSNGSLDAYYSGSGGSIWLTADKFEGAGTVRADAGWNTHSSYHGGGGRVSLIQTGTATDLSAFTGSLTAYGSRCSSTSATWSGAGTVYYEVAGDTHGRGTLIVDADNPDSKAAANSTVTDIYLADQIEGFAPKKLIARKKARVIVDATGFETDSAVALPIGFVPDASSTIEVVGTSDVDLTGVSFSRDGDTGAGTVAFNSAQTVTLPNALSYESVRVKFFDGCALAGGTVTVGGDGVFQTCGAVVLNCKTLTFQGSAVGCIDAATEVTGDVVVKSGAKLTHTGNSSEELYKLDLAVGGNLTIDEGGTVDICAKGYSSKYGPGTHPKDYVGGAHGGRGYQNSTIIGDGPCYGSIRFPFTIGSGSGNGGNGGGAAKLTVAKTFTLNGSILAYGNQSDLYWNASGGSIWITAAKLVGSNPSSIITASAATLGRGFNYNLSGGGRVAIHLTDPTADFSTYPGSITAYGTYERDDSHFYGGAGTVYLRKGSEAENGGTLIVDNGITTANKYGGVTEISSTVLDKEVGSVIVRNGAVLKITGGERLTVSGDITNTAKIETETGGGLVFAGSGVSHVNCDLTLSDFICQTPDKEIVFADGKTLTIAEGGRFQVEGTLDHAVTLRSETEGTAWKLNVDATAAQSVNEVNVCDSDASSGAEIPAVNSTLTRTTNWKNSIVVYGQTVRWTGGAGSSAWLAADNWDAGRAPLATDRIVIDPAAVAPVVADDLSILGLVISAGATLDLGGHTVTVGGDVSVTGRVVSASMGTIKASGAVDFSKGSVEPNKINLELAGDGTVQQTFNAGTCIFNRITVRSNALGARFTGNAASVYFSCETEEDFTLSFDPGKTLTVSSRLTLTGTDATLTLRSSTAGQTWYIDCPGVKTLSGLAVSDSTAKTGTMRAEASTDGGRNSGWDFSGGQTATWTGATSTDFHEAGNWSTGVVPGAADDVVIGSGTVVANAEVSAFSMRIEDGASVSFNRPVTVAGTLYMESGATLTHSGNDSTGANKVTVAIGGDFVLESGATIDVSSRGYPSGPGAGTNAGGSYGGRAIAHSENYSEDKTYGSILWPTDLGSNSGGGAVILTVAGLSRIDGDIVAKGAYGFYYAGSGGGITLKTRELVGAGTLSADGGNTSNKGYYFGGGGRIAVILTGSGSTFDSFTGSIHAYSGAVPTDNPVVPSGTPGTVYCETVADGAGRGTVTIDNSDDCYTGSSLHTRPLVDYPVLKYSPDRKEAKDAKFVLRNYVYLNIVTNAVMGDIEVVGSNAKILLNGHKLRIRSYRPADWPKDGSYPSYIIPGEDASGNPGRVVWNQGLSVIVR